MKKYNIKYRMDKYGKWIPENRKESKQIELEIGPDEDVKTKVLEHCQETIDGSIIEIMIL